MGTERLDFQMLPPPRAAYKQFLGQETNDEPSEQIRKTTANGGSRQ